MYIFKLSSRIMPPLKLLQCNSFKEINSGKGYNRMTVIYTKSIFPSALSFYFSQSQCINSDKTLAPPSPLCGSGKSACDSRKKWRLRNGCERSPVGKIFRMCEWSDLWLNEEERLIMLTVFKGKDEDFGSVALVGI